MAIASFHGRWAEAVWQGLAAKGFPPDLVRRAQVKLAAINAATSLTDLRVPPSNHLEALRGDRSGQHSLRINAQWRICFVWTDGAAHGVEIVDYH